MPPERVDLKKNLVLIGLSGSGKTTLGQKLAVCLKVPFYDMDNLIEQEEEKDIPTIFKEKGEGYFRDLESRMVREISEQPRGPAVVSTGGGVVLREENVQLLRSTGLVIHLTASAEELVRRVGRARGRPLLENTGQQEAVDKIEKMKEERAPLYERAAHLTIYNEGRTQREILEELLDLVSRRG